MVGLFAVWVPEPVCSLGVNTKEIKHTFGGNFMSKEYFEFEFEELYNSNNDLDYTIRDILENNFDVEEIANGIDFDISDLPESLTEARDYLENVEGMEAPSIFEMYEIDHLFANKSHTDVLNMMWFGSEEFNPNHDCFVIDAYGNFGRSGDYEDLLEEYMPDTRKVLDFAENLKEQVAAIVEDVVQDSKMIVALQEFADENDINFTRYGDNATLFFESDAGVNVSVDIDLTEVKDFDDLYEVLFDASNLDIDDYIKNEMGISGGPDIESIINTYQGGMEDEEYSETFAATFGAEHDPDRATELRDDAYDVRGKLDRLSMNAADKHREMLQKEKEQNHDKGQER